MATDCRLCTRFDMCYTTQEGDKPCFAYEPKKLTNGDRIRLMTDEDLAKKISGIEQFALTTDGVWPPEKWFDWLKQEAN